jgi:hypothetical protein
MVKPPFESAAFEAAEEAAGDRDLHCHGEGDVECAIGDEYRDGGEDGRARSVAP